MHGVTLAPFSPLRSQTAALCDELQSGQLTTQTCAGCISSSSLLQWPAWWVPGISGMVAFIWGSSDLSETGCCAACHMVHVYAIERSRNRATSAYADVRESCAHEGRDGGDNGGCGALRGAPNGCRSINARRNKTKRVSETRRCARSLHMVV
jgi:hypothetical protein